MNELTFKLMDVAITFWLCLLDCGKNGFCFVETMNVFLFRAELQRLTEAELAEQGTFILPTKKIFDCVIT